jgi:hypothetical protein
MGSRRREMFVDPGVTRSRIKGDILSYAVVTDGKDDRFADRVLLVWDVGLMFWRR